VDELRTGTGPERRPPGGLDLATCRMRLWRDGEEVSTGSGAACLGPLRMCAMAGVDPVSDGLARAARLGVATTADGVKRLLDLTRFGDIGVVFDADLGGSARGQRRGTGAVRRPACRPDPPRSDRSSCQRTTSTHTATPARSTERLSPVSPDTAERGTSYGCGKLARVVERHAGPAARSWISSKADGWTVVSVKDDRGTVFAGQ
jgi:hypothetical protein